MFFTKPSTRQQKITAREGARVHQENPEVQVHWEVSKLQVKQEYLKKKKKKKNFWKLSLFLSKMF